MRNFMDIFQLQCFVSAATIGNFTTAACENNISQSSFSKNIMNLEDELGIKLFFREKRSVKLTPTGEQCLEYSHYILNIYAHMQKSLSSFSAFQSHPIGIASIPVILPYGIDVIIFEIGKIFPEIALTITQFSESNQVMESLRRGSSDIAIMRTDFLDKTLYNMYPINEDRLMAVLPKQHPLSQRDEISISELRYEKMIGSPENTDLRKIVDGACIKAGFLPDIAYISSGNVEVNFSAVRLSGVAFMAMENVLRYYGDQDCAILPLEEEVKSKVAFVIPKDRAFSKVHKKLMNFFEEQYSIIT